jgi:hypothetical protein
MNSKKTNPELSDHANRLVYTTKVKAFKYCLGKDACKGQQIEECVDKVESDVTEKLMTFKNIMGYFPFREFGEIGAKALETQKNDCKISKSTD